MGQYFSRFVIADYSRFPPPPYKGKGWIITFENYPSRFTSGFSAVINDKEYPGKSVIIHASCFDRAQYVADLILGAYLLWSGRLPYMIGRLDVIPLDLKNPEGFSISDEEIKGPQYFGTFDVPIACLIARIASYRRHYQNAIFKYLLSIETFPTDQFELAPSNWRPSRFVSNSSEFHVRCAYSIVIAYSILEELGLEIRASSENPAYIQGKWNPKVRVDLETRLQKAGIDITDPIPWTLRDTPTRIERYKPPRIRKKTDWAFGKVRDVEVDLVDAIAYSSWMRSNISAHKLRDLATSLNYYDVSNVQHLARRILLERLGYWKYEGLAK